MFATEQPLMLVLLLVVFAVLCAFVWLLAYRAVTEHGNGVANYDDYDDYKKQDYVGDPGWRGLLENNYHSSRL